MQYMYSSTSDKDKNYYTYNPSHPRDIVGCYEIVEDKTVSTEMLKLARHAQAEWSAVPDVLRGEQVYKFLDAVEKDLDKLAESITLEQGKILAEAKKEILKGCGEGKFMCGEAARHYSQATGSARDRVRNLVVHRPRGTIFAISPWNFPVLTPLRKICPALVFGNAIILKPSQFTPAAAFILEEIAQQFFPKGLVQVMMCPGAFASDIISSADIDGVSFTGSVTVGRKVYSAAANNLIPVQLELGGKNGVIINDSSDVDNCLDQVFAAAFQTSGQRCTSISRVLVSVELKDVVTKGLAERASNLKLGDGMASDSEMGPLCNAEHWERVSAMTASCIEEGAEAVTGGKPAKVAGLEEGYFYEPTILTNVSSDSIAGSEEIFGPVLPIIEYETFEDAMRMLNETQYGLTSSLFSDSNKLIQKFINESQHGMMHVNNGTVPDINMPFGGMKNSGVGPCSVGSSAASFYTIEQAAYLAW